ncbi:hypothetical protein PMZ80_004266 [Knufia obscura]|uniref:Uncharacterized protein n=2 Tax=Knufia TaxID=430999 RepID=A0AAN8I410_9EURO|nr:hypothetical protein PMZ80_004266 [Knufia obscura]KAK5949235.1 hypothetical protein OHC33_009776 [Knufia fluminis]
MSYRRYSGLSNSIDVQNAATVHSASPAPGFPSQLPQTPSAEAAISPVTQATSVTPGQAPYEWWDLVAHDAAKSASSYQALKDSNSRWSFEPIDLSRSTAASPSQFLHSRQSSQEHTQPIHQTTRPASIRNGIGTNHDNVAKEPWNTSAPVSLSEQEMGYLRYYVKHVGPIFDLFDPERTFTEYIPHLAMRNVGLLKSVLAVSARFKSLHTPVRDRQTASTTGHHRQRSSFTDDDDAVSTQLYFETLSYLSKAMQYQSYTRSKEILATAALISSYEYFHVDRSADWEKHLKGVFWIQRSQETNGERGGLQGAVWWNWLRQDIWAALWQNRRPLTIWEPTIPVVTLRGHEFASRATFLLARAIRYATHDEGNTNDLSSRIADGERHLSDLQEWYSNLPPTYRPLPVVESDASAIFPPVWIHPPFHAAAMQHYYSAKILILLNRPSVGGLNAYHDSQRMLNEAVSMVCGLAQSPTALEFPSAMVHFQALYVAGRCVRVPEQQKALYEIFERVLESNRFPTKSLLSDLQRTWSTF